MERDKHERERTDRVKHQPNEHNDSNSTSNRHWMDTLRGIVEHPYFMRTVIVLILINGVIVGLETYPQLYELYSDWFYYADRALLWLFTIEIALRLFVTKPRYTFFKDGWNVFNFLIVFSGHAFAGAHFVTVLRILRILRLLRAITIIPSLRKLVHALMLTIPALGNICLLLILIFYIFSVIGTTLFADVAPEYFGDLQLSLITLFQVVTLESWASGVMRPIMAEVSWAWMYFVAFILVGTFVIFNLFVGVIVNNVEKVNEMELDLTALEGHEDDTGENKETADPTQQELQALRQEVSELKEMIRNLKKIP